MLCYALQKPGVNLNSKIFGIGSFINFFEFESPEFDLQYGYILVIHFLNAKHNLNFFLLINYEWWLQFYY